MDSHTILAFEQVRMMCLVVSSSLQTSHLLQLVNPRFILFSFVIRKSCLANQRKVWILLGIFSFHMLLKDRVVIKFVAPVIISYANLTEKVPVFLAPQLMMSSCESSFSTSNYHFGFSISDRRICHLRI